MNMPDRPRHPGCGRWTGAAGGRAGRAPTAGGVGRRRPESTVSAKAQLLPVLSTFCSSVLALLTVAVKLAPCIRDFIIVGMISSVVSAVAQFFAFSGEIWVTVAALANPDMSWLPEYAPPLSWEVYGGKKPCRLANEVELDVLSIVLIRSQSAVLYLLPDQTARSEPPAKAGAGFGPFWLGIGNDAQSDLYLVLTASSDDAAHGPSMYMSSLPSAKSSSVPPDVAPGLPSSVWPMYFDGETFVVRLRSA